MADGSPPKKPISQPHYKARGDGKTYKTTAVGTKTAIGFKVENLVTSTSDDTIIANNVANIFSGYNPNSKTGNDTIVNGNGQDKLLLSGYKSSDVTQTSSGKNLILGLGGNGSITLADYYAVNQNDRIQILYDGATPPPPTPPTPPIRPPVAPLLAALRPSSRPVSLGGLAVRSAKSL